MILTVALFLFGPKKLPELGKRLAEGIRGFKDAIKGGQDSAKAWKLTPGFANDWNRAITLSIAGSFGTFALAGGPDAIPLLCKEKSSEPII